jgi:ferritin-like metal-binding protein YciE
VFVERLKDIYSAENQILKAFPKMAKTAASPELQQSFQSHLEETRHHGDGSTGYGNGRRHGEGKKCKGMEGLLEEGKETLDEKGASSPAALDAAIMPTRSESNTTKSPYRDIMRVAAGAQGCPTTAERNALKSQSHQYAGWAHPARLFIG